jgi:hypothetical protein
VPVAAVSYPTGTGRRTSDSVPVELFSSQEMNLKDRETEHGTLTRRVVLTGSLGCALTLLLPHRVLGDTGENRQAHHNSGLDFYGGVADLYAFRASDVERAVIAATWTALYDHGSTLLVHAGEETWTVKVPEGSSSPTFANERGCQIFAGDILNRSAGNDARLKAVVIEAPIEAISKGGSISVWAERISQGGRRLRIGSPFIAKLIARNIPAAKLYHASSPEADGEEFTRLVAVAVSVNAHASGYAGNAELYGRRVASAITPDAMRFDPNLPVGFTFAAQNGRHPDDAAQSVVDTVLNGTLTPQVAKPRFPLKSEFPYFLQPFTRA